MDDNGIRENGRHKPDQYRSLHAQWMMPQHHQMKDHHTAQTIKLMAIISERDSAIHERDLAFSERKTALAEREMAIFQRDTAITERNDAIIKRDNAIAALEYYRRNNNIDAYNNSSRNMSHQHHDHQSSSLESSDTLYDHRGSMHITEFKKEIKSEEVHMPSKKTSKPRKSKKSNHYDDESVSEISKKHRKEWKVEELGGLNEVTFDESSMPIPVCSCTGKYQPCYKWGNGGWQSACCTTTLSMYPLPVMPNKRHARINGRKMSGSVFNKLLSRLAAEGYDLRVPLDLKDHWSKHGTNRYITIK